MFRQWKVPVSNFFLIVRSSSGGSHYVHMMAARLIAHVLVDLTIFVTSPVHLKCSSFVSSWDLSIKHRRPLTFPFG